MTPSDHSVAVTDPSLEGVIRLWLFEKQQYSGSQNTARSYARSLQSFRRSLAQQGLDLTSDPHSVALVAQLWASLRHDTHDPSSPIKGATYNQRLACLSSFYHFLLSRCDQPVTLNPITLLKKRSKADRSIAPVLTAEAIRIKLSAIDRQTPSGQRDYALLSVAVFTARRVAELAALRCGDLQIQGTNITLHFRHTKGGKQQSDTLSTQVGGAVRTWLMTVYGTSWDHQPNDAPVWVSCSRNRSAGQAISSQAIADLCAKHFGVSTVHTTRHSWAHQMDVLGAPVTLIQRRLGHTNVATTQRYLRSLPQPINQYGDQLEAAFGITATDQEGLR